LTCGTVRIICPSLSKQWDKCHASNLDREG